MKKNFFFWPADKEKGDKDERKEERQKIISSIIK